MHRCPSSGQCAQRARIIACSEHRVLHRSIPADCRLEHRQVPGHVDLLGPGGPAGRLSPSPRTGRRRATPRQRRSLPEDLQPLIGSRAGAETRIVAPLGRRKLRELSAEDVDRWLRAQAREVSSRTVRLMHSILNRAVTRAMARDKVKRNIVVLCAVPTGQAGRPSKSLTWEQAEQLVATARGSSLHAYIVLSLLTGARTEEVRALRWADVDLMGQPTRHRPCRRPSRSCARSASAATPRPAIRVADLSCGAAASTPSPRTRPAGPHSRSDRARIRHVQRHRDRRR
jgi:integrase